MRSVCLIERIRCINIFFFGGATETPSPFILFCINYILSQALIRTKPKPFLLSSSRLKFVLTPSKKRLSPSEEEVFMMCVYRCVWWVVGSWGRGTETFRQQVALMEEPNCSFDKGKLDDHQIMKLAIWDFFS